jgi:hypothetical protein
VTVDSGEEFSVEVRGAYDDVDDISAVPTPFTPACDVHPLAPIGGPIIVRGAKPGYVVAIDLIEPEPSDRIITGTGIECSMNVHAEPGVWPLAARCRTSPSSPSAWGMPTPFSAAIWCCRVTQFLATVNR